MLRTTIVITVALVLAFALILVLRRRESGHGPHWAVAALICLGAVGVAYVGNSLLVAREHARDRTKTMSGLRKEPLIGAFMSTAQGEAAVDAAVAATADLEAHERLARMVEIVYPDLRRMVAMKLGALDDDTTVAVAKVAAENLEASVRQGRGCLIGMDQIALEDMNGRPDLAIMVLRAPIDHFASRATHEEVDAIMGSRWPGIVARSGATSVADRDPAVQCRMGNMVLRTLSEMPPKTAAPAIRAILRL